MPNERRTSGAPVGGSLGSADAVSLDEYFKQLADRFTALAKDVNKKVTAMQNDRVRAQREAMNQAMAEVSDYAARSGLENENRINKARKALLEKQNKEDASRRAKTDNEIAKKAFGITTKYDKQRRNQELVAQEKANKETLAFYEKLQKEGIGLTEDQQKDLAEVRKALGQTKRVKREDKLVKGFDSLIGSINRLSSAIDSGISAYTKYQEGVNARLQGSRIDTGGYGANYFSALEESLTSAVGVTPLFSTQDMLSNLQALVQEGIASNVEQRAFIQTAKDEIATTFDASNAALLRIIRLQQQDSTAARLGMEAYLTRFLNELVENTEYLNRTFDTVQEALLEASSLMTEGASTEMEYVVQKWLGALTGVGLSESAASGIAQALGYLGSGNVESLNSSAFQNLLVMAASRSNQSYSELLTGGLSAQSADSLMRSMVEYMAEINSSGNNVVRSQFASTFGLGVSDLMAASNLASSLDDISGNFLSFGGMYDELAYQLGQVSDRLTMSGKIDTYLDNLQFGLASNIASNPASAAIWRITNMISDAGGINIPTVMALGSGVDMNATVEQLIRAGLVGVSSLGMIGDLVSGIGNTIDPAGILSKLGIASDKTTITRGTGTAGRSSGMTTSISAFVGNSSGNDLYQSTMMGVEQQQASMVAEAQADTTNYAESIYNYMVDSMSKSMDKMQKSLESIDRAAGSMDAALRDGTAEVSIGNMSALGSLLEGIVRGV